MTRTKRIYLALIALCLPGLASAEVIRVDYTGEVTSVAGDAFGYSIGDTITGWFEYDTDDVIDGSGYSIGEGPVDSNTGVGGYATAYGDSYQCDASYCNNGDADFFSIRAGTWEDDYYYYYDAAGDYIAEIDYTAFQHDIAWYFDPWSYGFGSIVDYTSTYVFNITTNEDVDEWYDYRDGVWFDVTTVTFTTVAEPSELLEDLETAVTAEGPGSSFADKIMLAQTYLDVPDEESACLILGDFLNQVRAQRGKKLTEEQADQFTADAVAIMDAVGCD